MELRDYILPLRKWWWLIVAATLVATVSSFLATRQQPPIYQTRTTVIIGNSMNNPNPNSYDYYQSQQLAATYADIVKRDTVRQATMMALGLGFLPEYSARTVPSTQLVEITVTDTDPARAQAVAKELVNQLIAISPSGQNGEAQKRQAFISGQLNELEDKIKATQSEITKKQEELTGLFSARQIADAQTQIAALQNKLASMQTNYTALLSNTQQGARNALNTLEEARLPTGPIGPNKSATILLAAVIGFALAAAAAYLLEYLDDTMKNPEDVEKALGLTTLGAAPVMKLEDGNELVVVTQSQSPISEAYRVLRTNLQFAAVGHPLDTLMITSSGPGEGKSMTAANLAAALAQGGRRVILVDGDLHRPRQHRVFGLRNNTGVTTALITDFAGNLDNILQDTAVPGLARADIRTAAAERRGAAGIHAHARAAGRLAHPSGHRGGRQPAGYCVVRCSSSLHPDRWRAAGRGCGHDAKGDGQACHRSVRAGPRAGDRRAVESDAVPRRRLLLLLQLR